MHSEDRQDETLKTNSTDIQNPKLDINEPFSKKEFQAIIKSLKKGKAVGFDSIVSEMITNAPEKILNLLHRFINLCLEKSLIPHSWCLDDITPIFKEGSRTDHNNYRGICISNVFFKDNMFFIK